MKLERGINLGGYLSQCVHSTEHYDAFIQEEDIRKIASMGFDHVRLAIDYEVLEDEYGRTREEGFAYVTRVVEWCKRQELNIVLDLHKAYGYDFNNAGDQKKNILFTNKMVQKRFVNLWIKIAEHYANETHVAFELLNEVVEQENAEAWNLLIAETVDAIRRIARDTIIIYGGIQWNSVKTLKLLEKPKDENILFTFHFYEPLLFTDVYKRQILDNEEQVNEFMLMLIEKSFIVNCEPRYVGAFYEGSVWCGDEHYLRITTKRV